MADGPTDPRWPTLLSLSAHEFRSPLSVVAGYIRMLLKERAGPLSADQRRLLEEAEKSCGRLSSLLAEVSELAQFEAGTAPFNRSAVNLSAVVREAITSLPELADRIVSVDPDSSDNVTVDGDAVRLRTALAALFHALRRELVTSDQLAVHVDCATLDGQASVRITIGEPTRMDALRQLGPAQMATFDEWRGGNGLSLPNARRVMEKHGGRIWSPAEDGKACAVIVLPGLSGS